MHRIRKRYHSLLGILLCIALMLGMPLHSKAYVEITTESAILMEASTGRVIFEQGADIKRSPASVTKVMTMLLTMEQIKAGNASLSDQVLVSENASKMGGSQVYLAQGEWARVLGRGPGLLAMCEALHYDLVALHLDDLKSLCSD